MITVKAYLGKLSFLDVKDVRFKTTDGDAAIDGDTATDGDAAIDGDDEIVFVANVNDDKDDGSDTVEPPCERTVEEMLPWLDEQADWHVSMATAVVTFPERLSSLTGDDDDDDEDDDNGVARGKFSCRTLAAGDVENPLVFAGSTWW